MAIQFLSRKPLPKERMKKEESVSINIGINTGNLASLADSKIRGLVSCFEMIF